MEVSPATISACTAKSLIVRQLQWTSVPDHPFSILLPGAFQQQNWKWMLWMLYWMHHRNLHSAETLIHCTCVRSSSFGGNDGLVAVEDSIDVGNVVYIIYDSLWSQMWTPPLWLRLESYYPINFQTLKKWLGGSNLHACIFFMRNKQSIQDSLTNVRKCF